MTPWPKDLLKEWDQLTTDERKLFLRQVDVFAAYVAYTDHEIGRVIQAIDDLGKLDDTLIIYMNGDNGTSAEDGLKGTPNEVASVQGVQLPVAAQLKYYDAWGSDLTYPHMAVGWSWAFDTPFSWTKMVASHFGGTKQGMAISWPGVIKDKGGVRHQFHHVIDIVPTILEAARIKQPEVVDGIPQKPIEGVRARSTITTHFGPPIHPARRRCAKGYYSQRVCAPLRALPGWRLDAQNRQLLLSEPLAWSTPSTTRMQTPPRRTRPSTSR